MHFSLLQIGKFTVKRIECTNETIHCELKSAVCKVRNGPNVGSDLLQNTDLWGPSQNVGSVCYKGPWRSECKGPICYKIRTSGGPFLTLRSVCYKGPWRSQCKAQLYRVRCIAKNIILGPQGWHKGLRRFEIKIRASELQNLLETSSNFRISKRSSMRGLAKIKNARN